MLTIKCTTDGCREMAAFEVADRALCPGDASEVIADALIEEKSMPTFTLIEGVKEVDGMDPMEWLNTMTMG